MPPVRTGDRETSNGAPSSSSISPTTSTSASASASTSTTSAASISPGASTKSSSKSKSGRAARSKASSSSSSSSALASAAGSDTPDCYLLPKQESGGTVAGEQHYQQQRTTSIHVNKKQLESISSELGAVLNDPARRRVRVADDPRDTTGAGAVAGACSVQMDEPLEVLLTLIALIQCRVDRPLDLSSANSACLVGVWESSRKYGLGVICLLVETLILSRIDSLTATELIDLHHRAQLYNNPTMLAATWKRMTALDLIGLHRDGFDFGILPSQTLIELFVQHIKAVREDLQNLDNFMDILGFWSASARGGTAVSSAMNDTADGIGLGNDNGGGALLPMGLSQVSINALRDAFRGIATGRRTGLVSRHT